MDEEQAEYKIEFMRERALLRHLEEERLVKTLQREIEIIWSRSESLDFQLMRDIKKIRESVLNKSC